MVAYLSAREQSEGVKRFPLRAVFALDENVEVCYHATASGGDAAELGVHFPRVSGGHSENKLPDFLLLHMAVPEGGV